jgi:hypothetical protein
MADSSRCKTFSRPSIAMFLLNHNEAPDAFSEIAQHVSGHAFVDMAALDPGH